MSEVEKASPLKKKDRAPRGKRTQKAMTFRLDDELSEWLSHQPNKGRYINDLILADMQEKQST